MASFVQFLTLLCLGTVITAATILTPRDAVEVIREQTERGTWHMLTEDEEREEAGNDIKEKHTRTVAVFAEGDLLRGGDNTVQRDQEEAIAELRTSNAEQKTSMAELQQRLGAIEDILRRLGESVSVAFHPPGHVPTDEDTEELSEQLVNAAKEGHWPEVHRLLAQGAYIGFKDNGGITALHWAARHCDVTELQWLIDRGAPMEAREKSYANTPLHWGAWYGCGACVRSLAVAGAVVDSRNNAGNTPLHDAATTNHEEAVRVLLEVGADRAIANNDGKMAAQLASNDAIRALLQ